MRTVLGNYVQGYLTLPLLLPCLKNGLLHAVVRLQPVTIETLCDAIQANEVPLKIVLHTLRQLGWMEQDEQSAWTLLREDGTYNGLEALLEELWHFQTAEYLSLNDGSLTLHTGFDTIANALQDDLTLAQYAKGLLLVPLLLQLKERGLLPVTTGIPLLLENISETAVQEITALFIREQWLHAYDKTLTAEGLELLQELPLIEGVSAYGIVLQQATELLFGDFATGLENGLAVAQTDAAGRDALDALVKEIEEKEGIAIDATPLPVYAYTDHRNTFLKDGQLAKLAARADAHGVVVLEQHWLSPVPAVVKASLAPLLVYLPLTAADFLLKAAAWQLFPEPDYCKKYPDNLPYTAATLSYFRKRNYQIRLAVSTDMPVLVKLEAACWPEALQIPEAVLSERLKVFPEGQLVVVLDGEVVAACYSQRITDESLLGDVNMHTVQQLHVADGAVVQLLALNVFPEWQHLSIGDQLLEFTLQRGTVMPGIRKIVGVTRCRDYHTYADIPLEQYIFHVNAQGNLTDTTLRLHAMHGATVQGLIPGYRPEDIINCSAGVLVSYDVFNRHRPQIAAVVTTVERPPVKQFITDTIKTLLGEGISAFRLNSPLMEMGLDSTNLIDLNEKIRFHYQVNLTTSFFFEYNTTAEIIAYLEGLFPEAEVPVVSKVTPAMIPAPVSMEENNSHDQDIAVIGMAFRFPGGAIDQERFWQLLKDGQSAIVPMPEGRVQWPEEIHPAGEHTGIDKGGFLDDISAFDAAFFRISPREAELMDPQQRILLELSWACMEDAGYNPAGLSGSTTGVFVGASGSDYHLLLNEQLATVEGHMGTAVSMSALPNRISYFYDFNGPSIQVDTACSSSLVAVHEAVKALRTGECTMALAGGINVICHPGTSISYYKLGMLSTDARCKTFDQEANGYVRGEGAALLLLKPLSAAKKDNDPVYAVIKGTATNHGGLASGYTVPNPVRQAELLTKAYANAGVSAATLSYLEAHGTGTSLGDPIEVAGLKKAFSAFEATDGSCGLGSVKTNIGHLEAAAGIAGLIKVVLSMQHQVLPASLHFNVLNQQISLAGSPFYIVNKTQPWDVEDGVRRVGVSSFGSGGANAHVVLEEYPVVKVATVDDRPQLLLFSAKNKGQLELVIRRFVDFLKTDQQQYSLADIAWTLQTGREAMEDRVAFISRDIPTLLNQLQVFLDGNTTQDNIFQGHVNVGQRNGDLLTDDEDMQLTLQAWLKKGKLAKLADAWVKGITFDWNGLYEGATPTRLHLPGYVFAHTKYWAVKATKSVTKSAAAVPLTVPLTIPAVPVKENLPTGVKPLGITLKDSQAVATTVIPEKKQSVIAPALLEAELKISLADALYMNAEDVDAERKFTDMGLDSVVGVEWIRAINKKYALHLPATRIYDYPTIREFAAFLQPLLKDTVDVPVVSIATESPVETITATAHDLLDELRQSLSAVLFLQPDEVQYEKNFIEMGMDSVLGVEWVRAINKQYGTNIQATKIYDYPTLKDFSAFFGKLVKQQPLTAVVTPAVPVQLIVQTPVPATTPDVAGYGLSVAGVHTLSELSLQAWQISDPAADEVCVEVVASAINFPDMLCVKGLYPTMPEYPFVPGFEVSGIVKAIGAGVTGLQPGDEVIALTGKQLGGHAALVNVPASLVVKKPAAWSFEEACSVPMAFVTAYHAFELGKLTAGEKILVQTASGGVGMMALQLAALKGAKVYATAGRPEKLALLNELDILKAIDYNTDFDKELQAAGGVDVVLNMLSGSAIQKGLNSLANGGRYLELAVHGLKTAGGLDLSRLLLNQSFYSIDLRRLSFDKPAICRYMLETMVEMGRNGQIVPLVSRVYPVSRIVEALQYVEQGNHTGKVVISHRAAAMTDHTAALWDTVKKQLQQPAAFTEIPAPKQERIAIIGMSGQFPQAPSLDIFWQQLREGKDCITEVPAHRWPNDAFYDADMKAPGKTISKWMGVLEDADKFDPLFFNISPAEAAQMDPQQRLFLENCWHCIEDAGIRAADLAGTDCGVFAGVSANDYAVGTAGEQLNGQGLMGNSSAILSARISYLLNLKGPSLAIDTACSSALVAIATACDSLLLGRSDLALAGGVNVLAGPQLHVMTSQAGMLSASGRCYAFDNRADGFVPGEGVGVVLLKRLQDAERDGDQIYGVISAWGVNQDGKTNGITAPSVLSQAALEEDVYRKFNIDPATIGLVEAHGTGTQLGDPIEVEALTTAFRRFTTDSGYCALGAVKSNIGHLLAAAGAAGVVKVLLGLKHREIPPAIHFSELNEHIELKETPFYINTSRIPWETRRRAAISSFGFSGTNAHIVIDGYTAPVRPVVSEYPPVLLLSAAEKVDLIRYAEELRRHISTNELPLADVLWTLQTGRQSLPHRLALVAESVSGLIALLEQFVAGESSAAIYVGHAKRSAPPTAADVEDAATLQHAWSSRGQWDKLAASWVNGGLVDWAVLYKEKPTRVSLPGYPFRRESYWTDHPRVLGAGQQYTTVKATGATLILQPDWQPVVPGIRQAPPAKHVLFYCGTDSHIEKALQAAYPGAEIIIPGHGERDIAVLYNHYAASLLDILQQACHRPEQPVLVQVLLTGKEESRLLAGLSGMLKTAAKEAPHVRGQIVMTDNDEQLIALIPELPSYTSSTLLRYERGMLHTREWRPFPASTGNNVTWKEKGVYLITGGAGGIGWLIANDILKRLKEVVVVLTGRSALSAEKQTTLQALNTGAIKVVYRRTDVNSREAVNMLIEDIKDNYGQLHGIVHSAGVISDNYLIHKTAAVFEGVLAPKIQGVINLDQATAGMSLDWVLLCSSVAAISGNIGQADYAAANAFMDAYAEYRNELVANHERTGRTLSVNWPYWKEGGMQVNQAVQQDLEEEGLFPMDTVTGLQALQSVLSTGNGHLLVLYGDTAKLKSALQEEHQGAGELETGALLLPDADLLYSNTLLRMKALFAAVTHIEAARIDEEEPLESYGIDSILITNLNRQLVHQFGNISRTLLFEYQTLGALTKYFTTKHAEACVKWTGTKVIVSSLPAVPVIPSVAPVASIQREPIAIIGISGRYPQAEDLSAFWQHLLNGKDCITEIPEGRWSVESFFEADKEQAIAAGKSYSKWGGFLNDFQAFDPVFFNITPKEALTMDPQERIFLEICWQALEDAGYTKELLDKQHQRRVGVFAGITKTGFDLYGPALWQQGNRQYPRTSFSSVANRISYLLNLQGPSMPVDTMCSSSLTAVHEACEHLLRGECEVAVAGGVNLYVHPSSYVVLSAYRMLSADSCTRSFGAGGDGFVPGEGAGAVILKRLSQAEADGDHIYGVIRGTGINHGGKTNGFTVPNPIAQSALIRDTLDKAGVNAAEVSYMEAHGTGTELGDPIEVTGITQAFETDTVKKQYCAFGSVKSNIGHLEAAAGIAGISKILLQMQHGTLVPGLHAKEVNPNIDFSITPLVLQQEVATWKRPVINKNGLETEGPRIAGVSSFGAGGSNAHAILQEYIPAIKVKDAQAVQHIIVLSALNKERLQLVAVRLLQHLQANPSLSEQLNSIAWTLQTGREAMAERLAFVATSGEEMISKLEGYINGIGVEGLYTGHFNKYNEEPAEGLTRKEMDTLFPVWAKEQAYERIAAAWITGYQPDWKLLYAGKQPKRISLPAYPFMRQHLWWSEETVVTPVTPVIVPVPIVVPAEKIALSSIDVIPVVPVTETISVTVIQDALINSFSEAVLLSPAVIDINKPFIEMGLDSIVGVEWMRTVNNTYQLNLPTTRVYDHPSIRELAAFIASQLKSNTPQQEVVALKPVHAMPVYNTVTPPVKEQPVKVPVQQQSSTTAGIAIIGMSGQFPMSPDLDVFWDNLRQGRDCITEIPADRWPVELFYDTDLKAPGKSNSKWMGILEDADKFDPLFFHISPSEAALMDPQQRLFLENSWRCIEHAGIRPRSLWDTRCGVFAGCAHGDYKDGLQGKDVNAMGLMGCSTAILSARIAYLLNLKGPCLTIDTACSSALVAIADACNNLSMDTCDVAIAGGVQVMSNPRTHAMISKAGMLSPTGHCYTFDDRADGFIAGEGVGVVLLKRLEDAERDGDQIYGVIRGWGVNQDGKTNGITAPSVKSQAALEQYVYEHFDIDPASITMVEAHGTGTRLGDPIEVEALTTAFRKFTDKQEYCALGSVKSNIGHLLTAAGVSSLIKVLLSIQHKAVPPTINFNQLNEHITLDGTPFYINSELQPWAVTTGTSRRAAVSSFGFSGTNVHMVIEEYVGDKPSEAVSTPLSSVFVLSAKTEERLQAYALSLKTYLRSGREIDKASLAYTLQSGRDAMTYRLIMQADDLHELSVILDSFLAGRSHAGYYAGHVTKALQQTVTPQEREALLTIPGHFSSQRFAELAAGWLKGIEIDWEQYYLNGKPARISAPVYPFARERYWLTNPRSPLLEVFNQQPVKVGISQTAGEDGKVSITLYDDAGNVCASFDQLTYNGTLPALENQPALLLAQPVWRNVGADDLLTDQGSRQLVVLCDAPVAAREELSARYPALEIHELKNTPGNDAASYIAHTKAVFSLIQAVLLEKSNTPVKIQVVVNKRLYAGLQALLRTARLENPRITGQLLLLDDWKDLVAAVGHQTDHPYVHYNNATLFLQAFKERSLAAAATPVWKENGVYLITGGAGGLGLLFAKEIVSRQPAVTLILTGRSSLNGEKQSLLEALRNKGAVIDYHHADIANTQDIDMLTAYIREQYGTLNGILHSAGQIRDNFIIRKNTAELDAVLPAKVTGLQLLDIATKDFPLDFFVTFSSVAGCMGNAGQADYAAANAFMDSYMQQRQELVSAGERVGSSLSLNWPLWKEGGMQIDAAALSMIAEDGFLPMETLSGMQAFYQALHSGLTQLIVLYGNVPLLRQQVIARSNQRKKVVPSAVVHTDSVQLKEQTLQALRELLAKHIQLAPSLIEADEPLESYGIDSILITTLNQELSVVFADIPKTLFFEYQTLGELANHLSNNYSQECAVWTGVTATPFVVKETTVAAAAIAANNAYAYEPIAIVGISGRYPQAADLREFWSNLSAGKESITEIPADRWQLDGFYEPDMDKAIAEGKSYSKWGGFISGFADFDPAFFNISPREALAMDPQERIFLEVCWEALEDAGYTKKLLAEKYHHQVGVFAGITKTGFDLYGPALWEQGEKIFPHTSFSSVANRISYLLNLQGPSLPVDTMCSSSLTAIHEACESLIRRECEVAIAGGVNLYVHSSSYAGLSAHRMLSTDGHLRSFGAGGNGFVPGEGAGSVILKRLSDAIADGDHIYAQIRATGINHGGKTNGYTVPNPVAQATLVRKTLDKAAISARAVSYIEAHGTGTSLGDPIEVQGLTQAFEKDTRDAQYCALGSVKSNIGHLEAAAGIAGITKIVLQLQHRQLVPSLHIAQENPNIKFGRTPLKLQHQLAPWQRPRLSNNGVEKEYPLIAGVSSFGAGGSNAHVILEEYNTSVTSRVYTMPAIVVLSAVTQERLQLIAGRLQDAISGYGYTDKELHRIAYTLQTGREPMQWRAALVVTSISELQHGLRKLATGREEGAGLFTGNYNKYRKVGDTAAIPSDIKTAFSSWINSKAYDVIASQWVNGAALPWEELYAGNYPQRISLPAYPFNRQRYWWNEPVTTEAALPEKPSGIRLDISAPVVEAIVPVQATQSVSEDELQASLIKSFATAILLPEEDIDIDKPFIDMGLDSIVGVEWIRTVNNQYNTTITVTKVYDHPSIREFAAYLGSQLNSVPVVPAVAQPARGIAVPLLKTVTEELPVVITVEELERELTISFATTILLPEAEVDIDKPFIDMGLDSIVGVEWIRTVNNQYNTAVTVTKVYDHPSIREFAAYLQTQIKGAGVTTVVQQPKATAGIAVPLIKKPLPETTPALPGEYGLVIDKVLTLDELVLKPWKIPTPGPGEVTIKVMASAVNFPDTMCVKGLYPTIPDYPFVPGFELSGVITAIGQGVVDFKAGDEVIALTGQQLGAHASHVNVDQLTVVRKPAAWSFEEACSLPVVFVTVYYAFKQGRLAAGEKVLIQTATGGCGLAAIQMAKLLDCTIFGTSSKQEKLDVLQQIGVPHTLSYKNDFDKEIRALTGNKGVDVVLNMLSGEAIQKGLNCLAPGGRYLELAVHGLKTSGKLSLSSLLSNQSFYSIDLRRTGADNGESIREMMAAVVAMAEAGEITPIVSRIYPVTDIVGALKYVDKGEHIGKVVISHQLKQMQDLTDDCIQRLQQVRKPIAKIQPVQLPSAAQSVSASPRIAIVGMSGQFPQAPDLDVYWDNLKNGRDAITVIPDHRWPVDEYYDTDSNVPFKTNSKWMGVLEDVDKFDPLFFNISPAEALVMDPQQRLFLENSWHCIEDAGIAPGELAGKRVGVFVGCATGDYRSDADLVLTGQGLMGAAASILSARISYVLNLKGPCLAIDTACSSALVAIADACNSLSLGSCEVALAGGVHVMANPVTHVVISKAGMLSPTGHCYTFDQRADGFVPGEGVGVVLLKRLEDAERDGDHIYGVISGWGVNQDGKTNGMTAPSVKSQIALEQEVYDKFNIDPAGITMLEAHGTGTRLGDPIEVEGLTTAFRKYTNEKGYCALGSVKSNIGHLLTASGMAGLMKVLLSMQHRMLPPTIQFNQLNEHVVIADSPFFVNDTLRTWETPTGQPRKAAISAFGFSGTNAHLVVEEYLQPATSTLNTNLVLIILSARTAPGLRSYAGLLRKHLAGHEPISLTDVAYTLQTGRDVMEYRMAFIAADIPAAIIALDTFIAGHTQPELFVGQVRKNNGAVDLSGYQQRQLTAEEWEHIAWNWINGNTIDWRQLYAERPSRISLPGYPFARESYWMKQDMSAYLPAQAAEQLHPLVQRNVSGLEGVCFESRFNNSAFFLSDHIVGNNSILPGVAYLEMAWAAWKQAGGKSASGLRNVVWLQPLVAGKEDVIVKTKIATEDGQYGFDIITTSSDKEILHSKGVFVPGTLTPAGRINIINLKQEAQLYANVEELYKQYAAAGIAYGQAYRCIEKLYQGPQYVLARLALREEQLPGAATFTLHPCLLDAAVQASLVLLPSGEESSTALAFELGEISFDAPHALGTSCWALLEFSDEYQPGAKTVRINITLCNDVGDICLRIRKLSFRALTPVPAPVPLKIPSPSSSLWLLTPVWDVATPGGVVARSSEDSILITGGTVTEREHLLQLYPDAHVFEVAQQETTEDIAERLQSYGDITNIWWIAPPSAGTLAEPSAFIAAQEEGLLPCFRLVKALLGLGYATRALQINIITRQAQAVFEEERPDPAHATLHGFTGTMAREHPLWKVRLIDLSTAEEWPVATSLELPHDPAGNAWAYRGGLWYRQQLLPVQTGTETKDIYRQGGVYVVIGGAGRLGAAWSEFMIRQYQARIIWIGRRKQDEEITAAIAALAEIGEAPLYISADATDRLALQQACDEIRELYGDIHGVVHSVLIMKGRNLHSMDEEGFKAGVRAKVDVSVRIAEVFGQYPLDFILFFSSVNSFMKAVGQSNYSAGCVFKDTFAQWLGHYVSCPVKVMNWGYWEDFGKVPSFADFEQWLHSKGIDTILLHEAMDPLMHLLGGSIHQLALMKTLDDSGLSDLNVNTLEHISINN